MDKILNLLEKYNCDLQRKNVSMLDFLSDNFKNYVNDLKSSINPEDNSLVGIEMCNMIADKLIDIENNCKKLLNVFRLYLEGKIVKASNEAYAVFEGMKPEMMYRYSGAYKYENYYRIRPDITFPPNRKELFHIPTTKRHLIGTERYSMPGHPCLYLASQAELCWYECGEPDKFTIARFDIPQDNENFMKFIDFSEKLIPLKYSFICWFHNESDKASVQKYLLKHICTYPLRASCSVKSEYDKGNFKEEYIISQLLLQWVTNDNYFDGIRYESCNSSEKVKAIGGHNIVLTTRSFDADGYDISLRHRVKVGMPQRFNIKKISFGCRSYKKLKIKRKVYRNDPFFWDMDNISAEYKYI